MSDIYQTITDSIVAAIESGAAGASWRMPWNAAAASDTSIPCNVFSRRAYRGINVLALWAAGARAGYSAGGWATYKQWQEAGCQVRKGERGTSIVFWKPWTPRDGGQADADSDAGKPRQRLTARGYTVFNVAQVDGYTPPAEPTAEPQMARIASADVWFAALGATVGHGGNRAYYMPSTDSIQMPPFAAFDEPAAYYSVLAHEHVHWTGDKRRCDRDLSGRFKSESYAAEELIAELGAAFVMGALGLSSAPRLDHARYVASWLRVLRDDKRAIFTASAKAQQAVDYMQGLATPQASQEAA